MQKTILLGKGHLSLDDINDIVRKNARIALSKSAIVRAERSYAYLLSEGRTKTIYGFNTGFGPMARIKIPDEKRIELQYNLIKSHAVGAGAPLPPDTVKAILIIRLNTLLRGCSGVPKELLQKLAAFINNDILPIIPEHGSVGASGDLVQLAHIALALIGGGTVWYKGKRTAAKTALQKTGIRPLTIRSREGIALINGTAAMSGIAALAVLQAERLLERSIASSAALCEISRSYSDAFSQELHRMRPHKGQSVIAARIRTLLKDSPYVRNRNTSNPLKNDAIQDVYSIRCAPQILGPMFDAIERIKKVIETEINSVTDNPIIIPGKGIFHGGNFHGDYIALEMDALKIAMTKLSLFSERRINFLLNDAINGILPPFLNAGTLGVDLGMQGAQFVATSTAAENQALSMPMSIHTIPSNKDNQDIVSMGVNAALLAQKVIENAHVVSIIEYEAIERACAILGIRNISKKNRMV